MQHRNGEPSIATDRFRRTTTTAGINPALPRSKARATRWPNWARLIGQADPFSNFGREQQAQPPRHDPHDQYAAHEPAAEEDVPAVRPSWVQNLAAGRHASQEPAYREEPYREEPYREPDRYDPPYADEQPHQTQGHAYGRQAPQFDHSGYDPVLTGQGRGQQTAASDRYDDVLYGRPITILTVMASSALRAGTTTTAATTGRPTARISSRKPRRHGAAA